jgi:DNA adenine methylase
MKEIRSPLRYPGGKSKAISKIMRYLPPSFSEYRESFVGGGSLFLHLKQKYPKRTFWINDLNDDLFCFWRCVQLNLKELIEEVWKIKNNSIVGKELFQCLTTVDVSQLSDLTRATRFFVLNRISFSGTVDCGGFSQKAFELRFTNSAIERLTSLEGLLDGVVITNFDYSETLKNSGENVFIYLDPPYLAATHSKLYGKRGDLHAAFDHSKFANDLKNCKHQWLITYDDSPEIRRNFEFAYIYEWEMQYGMNNYMQAKAAKGKELLITNYKVNHAEFKQLVLQEVL